MSHSTLAVQCRATLDSALRSCQHVILQRLFLSFSFPATWWQESVVLFLINVDVNVGMHTNNFGPQMLKKWISLLRWPPDSRITNMELPRDKKFKVTFLQNSCQKPIYTVYWGCAFGLGTALQALRSWFRFPIVSLRFFIDLILSAALWPWDRLSF